MAWTTWKEAPLDLDRIQLITLDSPSQEVASSASAQFVEMNTNTLVATLDRKFESKVSFMGPFHRPYAVTGKSYKSLPTCLLRQKIDNLAS